MLTVHCNKRTAPGRARAGPPCTEVSRNAATMRALGQLAFARGAVASGDRPPPTLQMPDRSSAAPSQTRGAARGGRGMGRGRGSARGGRGGKGRSIPAAAPKTGRTRRTEVAAAPGHEQMGSNVSAAGVRTSLRRPRAAAGSGTAAAGAGSAAAASAGSESSDEDSSSDWVEEDRRCFARGSAAAARDSDGDSDDLWSESGSELSFSDSDSDL